MDLLSPFKKIPLLLIGLIFVVDNMEASSPEAIAKVDTQEVLIGDWIHYTLILQHRHGEGYRWPIVGDSIGQFEVLRRHTIDTTRKNNRIIERQRFVLTIYDSGRYTIPPLAFVRKKDQQLTDTVMTNSISMQVQTVQIDTAKSITDIKSPFRVPVTFAEVVPYIIGGVLLLLLIGGGAWFYWQYRPWESSSEAKIKKPALPPHKEALEALQWLEEKKLWQQGEVKAHYVHLTQILKRYLERQFRIRAIELTSDETLQNVREETRLPKPLIEDLQNILTTADFAKFAKAEPLPDENRQCLQQSYKFVRETTPRQEKEEDSKTPENLSQTS